MSPNIITLSVGTLTQEELLNQPAVVNHLRYNTYIRLGDILLTTMFRDSAGHKHARDLGSIESLISFIEYRVSFSSVALRNGQCVVASHYNQPLPGMGIVTLEDLAQDVLIKLMSQSPKIITLAYLDTAIRCIGIDHKRKAVLRHTESLNKQHNTDDEEGSYVWDVTDHMATDPRDSAVFERLAHELSPIEQQVLLGLLGNLDGQTIADDNGIHRRTVYLVRNRIKKIMAEHM